MTTQLARYKELVPYQSQHAENGIPRQVMEYLAATRVFPVVSPEGLVGRNANARLRGWPGLCLTIAECVPGHGPVAHNHTGTLETFLCIDGRFEVLWGDDLKHKVVLEPGDLCSVPQGLYRSFKNLAGHDAGLLVLIQGDDKMSDKIEMPKTLGDKIRDQHGEKVLDLLAGINMRFQGEDTPEYTPAQMQSRIARFANLKAHTTPGGATLYPLMAPKGATMAAPVENWPGLTVAIQAAKGGEASTDTTAADQCQWLINLGEGEWEVAQGGERTVLKHLDFICVEPGTARTVKNLAGGEARLLVANQGRDTIRH
jgi:quercetin dioxygenase-like cupin family protein